MLRSFWLIKPSVSLKWPYSWCVHMTISWYIGCTTSRTTKWIIIHCWLNHSWIFHPRALSFLSLSILFLLDLCLKLIVVLSLLTLNLLLTLIAQSGYGAFVLWATTSWWSECGCLWLKCGSHFVWLMLHCTRYVFGLVVVGVVIEVWVLVTLLIGV